ncbi:NAD(P)-dependent oxidoreductase [Prosthecochloris sp. SCSIO W1101]|uniref:NAD(P)-dependent oxidoreductase n=1 Tax=Prosthecochloris sp. SCSIO W1101 TaxID=2992242 RepID=UPI00223DB941|nr:NAD(P)-dependent oxidoreductase [Prosthecochloris sp. SCSIO W1101]UZJ42569.1 NAD(P)-dependent oxidoreductase [Prosthecochloris sp. SCSIO W1101]
MNSFSPSSGTKQSKRVFVVGATGYIGKFVVRELVTRGYQVVSFARERSGVGASTTAQRTREELKGSEVRFGDVTELDSLMKNGICKERFDVVVSCLTSRTGGVKDSWNIDYKATRNALDAGLSTGAKQFLLLSAICVQKPLLEFQRAKLKFEKELIGSGLTYSIVRPTAFFKSIAGQVESVKNGKPFIMFGNGELTSCKPISEADLARFMVDCLEDPSKQNKILPIGGPGNAISVREQGEMLFELLGREPKFKRMPIQMFDVIIPVLGFLAKIFPKLEDKAEFARIGKYYCSESMLVLNPETGEYDAHATPSYGTDKLRDFYKRVLEEGLAGQELGDHAMF